MKFFDEYFVFSSSEKKGVLLFIGIILLMIVFYSLLPHFFKPDKTDFSAIIKEMETRGNSSKKTVSSLFSFNPNTISLDSLKLLGLTNKQSFNIINYRNKIGKFKTHKDFNKIYSINDSLAAVLKPYLQLKENTSTKSISNNVKNKKDSLFIFNPNKVSIEQLELLGFKNKQAATLINYREKGGVFYKKEDFKKVYSVTDKMYDKLEHYIAIEKPERLPDTRQNIKIEPIEIKDLNKITKEELIFIRGIGDKTSERILKYRSRLGGFISLDQLEDIYGMDSLILANRVLYFKVDISVVTTVNINTVTFKELLSHPYCDYNSTKKIINYREMHGNFISVEQILKNNLINAKQYRKIASYLVTE